MRIPWNSMAAAAAVLGVWLAGISPGAAQPPAPRLANGKPDLNGAWQRPYVPDMTRNGRDQKGEAELPFTPAGLADWSSYDAANGDYTGSCFPFGLMRSVNAPYPLQILQTDKYVGLLFETNTWFHLVPIDGRNHPKDVEPTWFGSSIGKWDGDTLVVDTIGFNGYTRLDTVGHPHSDALHMIQTFRRPALDRIEYTVTIDDPKMYTKTWKNERTFTPLKGELMEYSCQENNRSLWEGRIKMWVPPWVKKP